MKKIISLLLVIVVVFVSFAACGGSNNEDEIETTTRPAAQTVALGTIYNDMTENFVKAQKTYSGKVYSFTATVHEIYEWYVFANLSDESGTVSNITISFLNSDDILEFSNGDTIKVEGYIEFYNDGRGLGFDIEEAVLIKE